MRPARKTRSTTPRGTTPRPYLRNADRREHLLSVAADLVGRKGWDALGMLALAEAAGVSRQLVYEHFPDVSALLLALMRHLFDGVRAAISPIAAEASDDVVAVVTRAYDVHLDMPRAQRRALRALAGDAGSGSRELRRAQRLMRDEIIARWVPFFTTRTGLPERQARALAWMMHTAAWGVTDLVEDGTLAREEARALLTAVVAGALRPGRATFTRR